VGKVTYVTCIYCRRKVPRDKAIPLYKKPSWLAAIDPNQEIEFVGWGAEKVYVCISCAKHRGISFRDWREKVVREDRKVLEKKRKKALGRKRGGKKTRS
jgi:ribosomal protein S26